MPTQRASEVLWEAVIGKGYHEIATALGMQPTTVRNHLQRILTRLGAHSQRQARGGGSVVRRRFKQR